MSSASPGASVAKKCKHHKKKRRKGHKKAKKCKKHSPSKPSGAPTPTTPGPEYIELGDSISAGLGASTPANSFVSLLFAHYKSTLGVTSIDRLGQPGATSASLLSSQLGSAVNEINGPSDTRVVTIDIGGNDGLSGCAFGASPCTDVFKSNFTQALSQLQGALAGDPGDEPLIAMAYYNPESGVGGTPESSRDTQLLGAAKLLDCSDTGDEVGLNDAIAQIAGAHGALLANPYPVFKANGQAYISGDHLHPNDPGHSAIADAFIAAVPACP
jgi:lysophospholipase L1-like esterase